MNTTQSANSFSIPADVATRILCEPKNRTTGKLRRRAWAARTKVIVSGPNTHIVYPNGQQIAGERKARVPARRHHIKKMPGNPRLAQQVENRSKSGAEKFAGKLRARSIKQLLTWERRTMDRIKVLNRLADKLEALKEGVTAEHVRARIQSLHAVGGLLQQEIDTRG